MISATSACDSRGHAHPARVLKFEVLLLPNDPPAVHARFCVDELSVTWPLQHFFSFRQELIRFASVGSTRVGRRGLGTRYVSLHRKVGVAIMTVHDACFGGCAFSACVPWGKAAAQAAAAVQSKVEETATRT